jgi:hypothetical protein
MPPPKNISIENPFKWRIRLEYGAVFPGEKLNNPSHFLKGISREMLLAVAVYFLGFKNRKSEYEDIKKLFEHFFCSDNKKFAVEMYNRIKKFEKEIQKTALIINPYASLKLFQHVFESPDQKEIQSNIDFEQNVFRAYLTINEEMSDIEDTASNSTRELEADLRFPMLMFCSTYFYSDVLNTDVYAQWANQTIKAIFLFRFLENNPLTIPLLTVFLKHFNCKTWKEYLKRLLPLSTATIQSDREGHIDFPVTRDENFHESCLFIEKLIVQNTSSDMDYDFINLRARPFYKISDGVYRLIFGLFTIEKIFKGLYFILKEINDKQPPAQKISNLKAIYGEEFSEHVLLYEILKIVFPGKYICYSGKEIKSMGFSAEPDYYIRRYKKTLLFESKDILIPAVVKQSGDFNKYQDEFEKRLYFENKNGKEKPGAVMQLINNIKRILKNEFTFDKDYFYKDIFIYPILVLHDQQYETAGLNKLIDYWFQAELEILEGEGFYTNHIKPLVIINIDTLIYHQDLFNEEKIILTDIIDSYIEYTSTVRKKMFASKEEAEEYFSKKIIPFSIFCDNYISKLGLRKIPKMLHDYGLTLFQD